MASWSQSQRLETVLDVIRAEGARSVLDLGCGDGDLLVQLAAEAGIERIVGIDLCRKTLDRAQARLAASLDGQLEPGPGPGPIARARVELVHDSFMETGERFRGFDCAALVETIEHIEPQRLSVLERAVFDSMRPATVVITTPNAELNPFLDVPDHRFRHPDHRFEWDRAKFSSWSEGVARRNDYRVACSTLAGRHPRFGGATQMAVFRREHVRRDPFTRDQLPRDQSKAP